MTPTLLIPILAFVAVAAVVGVLAFVFRDGGPKTANRLDVLVGKRTKEDAQKADILRKTAFEGDKKSLLEVLTPNIPSLNKIFEQADCHIKPSTLFGIGMGLALFGATATWLARVPIVFAPLAGMVLFTIPFIWLLNK